MRSIVKLYSNKLGEISRFLNSFFDNNFTNIDNTNLNSEWSKEFENPIEITDIISAFIDNNDNYDINMWVSLDEGAFINVTEDNVDELIKYLYERFPY